MPTTEPSDPRRQAALLPQFTPPPPPPPRETPDPETNPETLPPNEPQTPRRRLSLLPDVSHERSDPDGSESTRTDTSSRSSKPATAADVAIALAGVLALGFGAAAVFIRWRMRAQLRRPVQGELLAIARPLADIALRRVDSAVFNKDLIDVARTGGAVGAYVNNGPLLRPLETTISVPQATDEGDDYS